MTGAHWLLLAASAGFAVLVVLLTRRRPRVWRREEIDEIRDRARERSERIRRWADEPGDLLPIPVGQTDPRVADLEHMTGAELARFIADCAEAAAVIERQWGAANAELAERHRAGRRG